MKEVEETEEAKASRIGAAQLYRAMGRAFVEGCPELGQLHEGLGVALAMGDEAGVELLQKSIVEVLTTLADVYEKVDTEGKSPVVSLSNPRVWIPKLVSGGKRNGKPR